MTGGGIEETDGGTRAGGRYYYLYEKEGRPDCSEVDDIGGPSRIGTEARGDTTRCSHRRRRFRHDEQRPWEGRRTGSVMVSDTRPWSSYVDGRVSLRFRHSLYLSTLLPQRYKGTVLRLHSGIWRGPRPSPGFCLSTQTDGTVIFTVFLFMSEDEPLSVRSLITNQSSQKNNTRWTVDRRLDPLYSTHTNTGFSIVQPIKDSNNDKVVKIKDGLTIILVSM